VIPNITTDVGKMVKDKVDDALDKNPKVKNAIDTAAKVAP
jgi:hypothetical protein